MVLIVRGLIVLVKRLISVPTRYLRLVDDTLIQFGLRVRDARKTKGLSQEELADLCGLDRSYVGGVERGERNVSLKNIARIANALNLTPSDLLSGVADLPTDTEEGDA